MIEPLIVANIAFNNTALWTAQKSYILYIDIFYSVIKDFYAASSAIQCLHNTIENSKDITAVKFPALLRMKQQYISFAESIPLNNLIKAAVYASTINSIEFGLVWIDLSTELFGDTVSSIILTKL